MDTEKEQQLFRICPKLFSSVAIEQEAFNTRSRPFHAIAFGLECGNGWFDILKDLCVKIEAEINKLPEVEQQHYVVHQIKEKYGTLRFYMASSNDAMEDLISVAESRTEITCENCGAPGTLKTQGWWKVRCEACK